MNAYTGISEPVVPDQLQVASYSPAIAVSLSDLVRKNSPNQVVWSHTCEQAFTSLKKLLCTSPVLWSPDFSKPFVLQTDASDRGVGAILSQLDENGCDHPIAYFSRKLLPREERYATIEKECLASSALPCVSPREAIRNPNRPSFPGMAGQA